jgi:hypothetical protein
VIHRDFEGIRHSADLSDPAVQQKLAAKVMEEIRSVQGELAGIVEPVDVQDIQRSSSIPIWSGVSPQLSKMTAIMFRRKQKPPLNGASALQASAINLVVMRLCGMMLFRSARSSRA